VVNEGYNETMPWKFYSAVALRIRLVLDVKNC